MRQHCGRGPPAECHNKQRAAVIAARRTERSLWIARHLRDARKKKVGEEGIEPHPGPSSLSLLSLNVAGEDYFWGFLKHLETMPSKPDAVA